MSAVSGLRTLRGWGRRSLALGTVAALAWTSVGGGLWRVPPAAAAPGTVVRCDPTNPSTPYTSDVAVDVYVEDVVDLYGADVQLSFDTGLAQVVDTLPDWACRSKCSMT